MVYVFLGFLILFKMIRLCSRCYPVLFRIKWPKLDACGCLLLLDGVRDNKDLYQKIGI